MNGRRPAGTNEDLEIMLAIQRSRASGANECFTFGHFEVAPAHFHATLNAVLAS